MTSALYDPAAHEPLTTAPWSAERAQTAIAAIVADAEAAFDPRSLWPAHPLDDEGDAPLGETAGLYLGASGVLWAFDALARAKLATPARDWAPVAAALPERYAASPDLAELTDGRPVPSLLVGESGVLLAAHRYSPAAWQVDRLVECVRANRRNPVREFLWGSPGTMIAARLMYERTGDRRLIDAWRQSAAWLIDDWRDTLWTQDLYGQHRALVGAGHGFAGNVLALTAGEWLGADVQARLEQRAIQTLLDLAERDADLAQWWPTAERPQSMSQIRTQWCHGAPGMITSFAHVAPHDASLTDLLAAGGELVWRAGPLLKGPGICHGTAGNGYAFLKLYQRTADELVVAARPRVCDARLRTGAAERVARTGGAATRCGPAMWEWRAIWPRALRPTRIFRRSTAERSARPAARALLERLRGLRPRSAEQSGRDRGSRCGRIPPRGRAGRTRCGGTPRRGRAASRTRRPVPLRRAFPTDPALTT